MQVVHPNPPSLDALIRDVLDPGLTMAAIASKYALSLLELVRILKSPEFRAPLDEVIEGIQDRARLLASASIHSIVKSQRLTIDECIAVAEADPITPESAADPKAQSARTRLREQSRKAANLLLRAAKPPARAATRAAAIPAESSCDQSPRDATSDTVPRGPGAPAEALPSTVPRAA